MRQQTGPGSTAEHDDAPIVAIAYTPPAATHGSRARRRLERHHLLLAAGLATVVLVVWFLLTASVLRITTQPAAADIDVAGGFHLALSANTLLRPGEYRVTVTAAGHASETRAVTVADGTTSLDVTLAKLPGRVSITTTPTAAAITVDGEPAGQSNGEPLRLAAGKHIIEATAERYLPQQATLDVTGMDQAQELTLALAPGWGSYRIETSPPGARVLLDATELGTTPGEVELLAGTRTIRVQLAGYRDVPLVVDARAGERRSLPSLTLQRADAELRISSRPAGASITLDGVFQGTAPLTVAVDSVVTHTLVAFKTGHEPATRQLAAGRAGVQDIMLDLPAVLGRIDIAVTPADAEVVAGGSVRLTGSGTLQLAAVPQMLTVRRAGYVSQELKVTPRPGLTQALRVTLRSAEEAQFASASGRIRSASGAELVLLRPTTVTLGSSRREVGRRANEVLHTVTLRRPFYLGLAEVSNAEYRRYQSGHSSGHFKGKSLNGEEQPAVNVSWEEAALYCNWLSKQERLEPFYTTEGGVIVGMNPASTGYRLPTEAEWAWAAGVNASGAQLRFPWGPDMPPPAQAGNFADKSGAAVLGDVIEGYDDGFAAAAPRMRFAANRHGLFDLAGNAAEWVNDHYDAALGAGGDGAVDPLGPEFGDFHVVRGSSWRQGSVTELRTAYRDYGKDGRPDLGFRIARYLQ